MGGPRREHLASPPLIAEAPVDSDPQRRGNARRMSIHDQIHARIEAFSRELEELVRTTAIDAVRTSLGDGRPTAPRPTPKPTTAKPTATSAARTPLSFKRKKGAKRSPEQLAAIDSAIVGYVKSNAGKRIEDMGKSLGVPTNDLKLRVALLVQKKALRKTGVKRATKYFVT